MKKAPLDIFRMLSQREQWLVLIAAIAQMGKVSASECAIHRIPYKKLLTLMEEDEPTQS